MNANAALDNGTDVGRQQSELKREIAKLRAQLPEQQKPQSGPVRLAKALTKGFGNIAQSLNTPASKQRPRIARIMETKPDIVNMPHKMNAQYMKHPSLRGQTIQGTMGRPKQHLTPQDVYQGRVRYDPYRR